MWTSTIIPPAAFKRWQQGLTDARLIKEPLDYNAIVNDQPATAAQRVKLTDVVKKSLINGKSVSIGPTIAT
jgi:NitT/TauT family transport system substrate-binding protein